MFRLAPISPFLIVINRSCLLVGIVFAIFVANAQADDWPQWRGPNRDGTWNESGILDKLPAEPKVKWRTPIGTGYSGPTVANGKVYVMDRMTKPDPIERVLCFDSESGKLVWKHEYPSEYRIGYTAGPRASVTVVDGLALSHGAMGQLICFDATDGKIKWEIDLNKKYSIQSRDRNKNRMPIWGMTCSPFVYKGKAIVQVGAKDAGVIAFDLRSGDVAWQSTDDRGQYSSPVLTKQGDRDVLICWTGESVTGLDPNNGDVFWSIPWKPTRMPIGCASPIVKDHHVFCTSFYDGAMLIRLNSEKPEAEMVWHKIGPNEKQTEALHSIISTPVWIDDHIYGVDSYGEFRCLEAQSGKRIWEDQTAVPRARWSTIHFVQNSEKTWMFNERGELIIGLLTPKGFKENSRTKIIEPTKTQLNRRGGVCWSHPAFALKCVFARNDNELVCVDLSGK